MSLSRNDLAQVVRILNSDKTPAVQVSPFVDLPPDVEADLRSLIEPIQQRGLPLEVDPVMKACVGTMVENQLFRIAVLTHPTTGEQRAAVLGPDLREWEKEVFLALLPDLEPEEPAPPVATFVDRPSQPDTRELLAEILSVQREILAELRSARGDQF